eukprot:1159457-Pelagomonas_calceolata.AAC.4
MVIPKHGVLSIINILSIVDHAWNPARFVHSPNMCALRSHIHRCTIYVSEATSISALRLPQKPHPQVHCVRLTSHRWYEFALEDVTHNGTELVGMSAVRMQLEQRR